MGILAMTLKADEEWENQWKNGQGRQKHAREGTLEAHHESRLNVTEDIKFGHAGRTGRNLVFICCTTR